MTRTPRAIELADVVVNRRRRRDRPGDGRAGAEPPPARRRGGRVALANSFGLGGHNAVLAFSTEG
jgi:3-oxoacyl-(acyl-carrier-protein) synthase